MRSLRLALALVFLSIFVWPSLVWSAVEISPRFTLAEEYNDNIFLSSTNRTDDWITTVQPGLSLTYEQRSVSLAIDYSLRYRFYKDNSSESEDSFRDVQRTEATALFFGERPFTVSARATIARESLETRELDVDFDDTVDRSTVYRFSVSPEYQWRISPLFSMVFGYTYDLVDYVESAGVDYSEQQGRVSLTRSISPVLDLWVRYVYAVHDSDDDEDFDRQDVLTGANYRLGARTTLSGSVGYSDVEYDNGFDSETTLWAVDLSYQLTDAVGLSWSYNQDFSVSATDGVAKNREARFTTDYSRGVLDGSVAVYYRDVDYLRKVDQEEIFGVRLNLSRQLSQSFSTTALAGYERARFEDNLTIEHDDRYLAGIGISHTYRRFVTTLDYRYRAEESEVASRDYTNNIVSLSGTVRF